MLQKNAIMKPVVRTTPSKSVHVWHQKVPFIKLPCGSYMLEFGNHYPWTIAGSSTFWHIQITWGFRRSWLEWAAVLSGHRAWASGASATSDHLWTQSFAPLATCKFIGSHRKESAHLYFNFNNWRKIIASLNTSLFIFFPGSFSLIVKRLNTRCTL